MPVRISNLVRDRRTVTIPIDDDVVTITYRPGGFTPETEDRLRQYADDQRGGAALVALLADCLIEWDLVDDDGRPLKPTAENLRRLPTVFLSQVAQAIAEDMRPNLPIAGSSGAGLLPRAE